MSCARPDTWMPFYPGDYLRDTMHLTTEAHGAYLLLLMTAWVRGGALPGDDGQLCAITRLPPRRWAAVKPTIMPLFYQSEDGGWRQKRVEAELARATKITKDRSEAGKKGAGGRWKADGNADGKRMANASGGHRQTDGPSQSQLHPKNQEKEKAAGAAECRAILETVLDGERAQAVIEHRKLKRAPLTARAAKLLAEEFTKCRDGPNAAADAMISGGWQGFRAEWMDRNGRNKPSDLDNRQSTVEAIDEVVGLAIARQRRVGA